MKQLLTKRSLYWVVGIAIFMMVYVALLTVPLPSAIGLTLRHTRTIALVIVALGLYPFYCRSGRSWAWASLGATLIVFALPLSGLWNSGVSEVPLMGGLFPVSDGLGYYTDALRLLEGQSFSFYSTRRPLSTGALATLLALSNHSLQIALALMALLIGISCFLAAREVQRTHGAVAGVTVITILFFFARRWIGTTWTEGFGLTLAATAFALLWRGTRNKQPHLFLLGLLLLTVALSARAGAFFVLPILVVWSGWFFRGRSRLSLPLLGGGVLAVFGGFAINSLLMQVIGDPDTEAFSNFSYVFYGLVVGGKGWMQIKTDHPEIFETLSEPELSERIYQLAFAVLRENPWGLLQGALRAWSSYLNPADKLGAFSFISTNVGLGGRDRVSYLAYVFYALSLLGLYRCCRQRWEANHWLVLAISLGILLSVPLVPPTDAQRMRAYAATIPLSATLPAIGLAFMVGRTRWNPLLPTTETRFQDKAPLFFATFLLMFSFLGPIATKALSRPVQFASVTCPSGKEAVHVRLVSGSMINLQQNQAIARSHMPNIRTEDFRQGMQMYENMQFRRQIHERFFDLSPRSTLVYALDLNLMKPRWAVIPSHQIPPKTSVVGICGKTQQGVLHVNSVTPVGPN